ncbi:MAG TPA: hypothetical protein VGI28_01665 [Stellaceae bacterium]|jgi:hypothetical protein
MSHHQLPICTILIGHGGWYINLGHGSAEIAAQGNTLADCRCAVGSVD